MKRFLAFAIVLTSSLVVAQAAQVEHAPTVEQCQADQRLWFARIEEGDSPRLPIYDVLTQWRREMGNCEKVDAGQWRSYRNTEDEIDATQSIRLFNFLKRHKLWQQFDAEDAAGKR